MKYFAVTFSGEVYWTDTAYRQIGVADPRTGKCRLVVYRDLGTIEGIAVDHIGKKVRKHLEDISVRLDVTFVSFVEFIFVNSCIGPTSLAWLSKLLT